jgi:hypothetical protein
MLNRNILVFAFILLGVMLIASTPSVNAQTFSSDGNPGDTASGEVINIFATNEAAYYQDANLNNRSTNAVTDISYTTSPEYGLSMNVDITDLNIVSPGDLVNHSIYVVTNEGNTTLPYDGSYYFEYGGGASGWTVEVWQGAGPVFQPLIAGTVSTESKTLSEDSQTAGLASRFYRVYVSPNAAEAPNGAYIDVFTTYEVSATPVGTYEGANTLIYGGTSEARDYFRDEVQAPELVISRAHAVDSPDTYTGGDNDYVPGAVVTFTLTYTNEGSAEAREVILIDKIPTKEATSGTNLAHVNGTGNHGNVTLTPATGTAADWTVSYSTIATPATTYGATADWTQIGTVTGNQYPSASGLYETGSSEYDATWIKWEKSTVEATEVDKTIVWGVTIR